MGYQVGNHCYATKSEAENVYFSLVVPVISTTTSGTTSTLSGRYPPSLVNQGQTNLLKPDYVNGGWVLNGQTIQANLPECDPVSNFKQGQELGWLLFAVIGAMYVFVLIKKLIR